MEEQKSKSIDQAIDVCDTTILRHRSQASFFSMILFILACLFIIVQLFSILIYHINEVSPFSSYISYTIFIILFGIFVSFYRFHQKEVSKYEHYLIGLHRIRIAANNSSEGFDGEVRTSLTKDAFNNGENGFFSKKNKQIESPLPGHPTSDITVLLLNKILDTIEVTVKPKKDKE